MAQQIFGYEEKSPRNGIYSSVALEKLKNLLEKESYTTDFFNILLNQDNNKTELAIVTPSKFYKSFKELGEEPRVPENANENNIISFYKENFTKYNNVVYDEKTFVADKSFPEFETEVFLVSTFWFKYSSKCDGRKRVEGRRNFSYSVPFHSAYFLSITVLQSSTVKPSESLARICFL